MPPTYSKCICQRQHSRKLKVFQFRKFLTIDNLQKRKVWILDWCYRCNCKGESVDHFFLHCPIAMDLWSMVLVLFGVSWVMLQSIVGLLACWQGKFGHHRNGHIWLIVPHCLMWCLWRERNRCFEDNERSIPELKLSFFSLELYWIGRCHAKPIILFFSWFPWFLSFLYLNCWPLVHSLCTRVFHFLYQ